MRFKKKYYTSQVDERDCGCAALSMVLKVLLQSFKSTIK
ncbi:cysteine peptidase family C39 domain-containing protein [Lactococcus petauri]|nr:hypothetical protein [Lactococcus petauri]